MNSHCPFCKSEQYSIRYSTYDIFNNDYEMAECQQCRAYFLTPNPTDELLAIAYDDSYYGGNEDQEKFEGFIEKALSYFRNHRANKIIKLSKKEGRILDIGCGNGQFLDWVKVNSNCEIFGTEMEGSSAQRASKVSGINLKIGELSEKDYPRRYFDVITMFHVFEHLKNPKDYLDIIDQVLKEDGHFVASFPNIDSWQARFFKGKWLHLDPPRHLFFFKAKDLKHLMKERGYELVSESYFSIEQNPFGAIQSYLNLFHKKRELLFEALKGNDEYTKGTSRLLLAIEKLTFIFFTPFFVLIDILAALCKKSATVEFVFRKKAKKTTQ